MLTHSFQLKILTTLSGFFLLLGLAGTLGARAANEGALDPTFQIGSGFNNTIAATLVLPDGKIIVAGDFTGYEGQPLNYLARLNSDGTLDATFNAGGSGTDTPVARLYRQPNGKIIIAGDFTSYNGVARNGVARLNADGTLDLTFNASGNDFNGGAVLGAVTQSDGKLILIGSFTKYKNVVRQNLVRLNLDDSLDETYNFDTGVTKFQSNLYIKGALLQPDDKLLLFGEWKTAGYAYTMPIFRLNSDSSLDASFGSSASNTPNVPVLTVPRIINAIALQADGKIVLAGRLSNDKKDPLQVGRLTANGLNDNSFSLLKGLNWLPTGLHVYPDGKILVTGDFRSLGNLALSGLLRLNSSGTLENSFSQAAKPSLGGSVSAVTAQPDGKLLLAGKFSGYLGKARTNILRLNSDDSLDESFATSAKPGFNRGVMVLLNQPNQELLVGGAFTHYGGTYSPGLVRLTPTGAVAATFDLPQMITRTGEVNQVAELPDGHLLVAVRYRNLPPVKPDCIYRVNSDGSLDANFSLCTYSASNLFKFGVQPSGKIVVAGSFADGLAGNLQYIRRYNTDGTLDSSFNPTFSANSSFNDLAFQPDGKIIIAGSFYNTLPNANRILRLTPDGAVDNSFVVNTHFEFNVEKLFLQPDGKFLALGFNPADGLRRFNPDGSLDSSFVTTQTYHQVLLRQADGKLIVVRQDSPENYAPNILDRLNVDGSVDSSFAAPLLANEGIYAALIQGNSKLLVGGEFTGFGTFPRSGLASFEINAKSSTALQLTSSANPAQVGQPLTFTASLSPLAATGVVTFTLAGNSNVTVPLNNGVASYVTTTLPAGVLTVTATYGGDANFGGAVSPVYTQAVTAACNPLVVTLVTDDGTGANCGTFSHALRQATSGQTVTFALTAGSTVTFTGSLSPTVPSGIILDGGASGVVLNGNGVAGDGLRLSGGDILRNLTIRRFAGRELVFLGGGNQLYKVRLEN